MANKDYSLNTKDQPVPPLPAGAATAANQVLEIAQLTSLNNQVSDKSGQAVINGTIVAGNASLSSIDAKVATQATLAAIQAIVGAAAKESTLGNILTLIGFMNSRSSGANLVITNLSNATPVGLATDISNYFASNPTEHFVSLSQSQGVATIDAILVTSTV